MPWRQQSALIEVFVASAQALADDTTLDLIGESGILAGIDVSYAELTIVNQAFASDLAGQRRIDIGRTERPNVLLILLEGVCGAHIEAICRPTGVKSNISMPYLDELARTNLCYSNFLTHQGQTNRGLYSILAGDFPRLTTAIPKMAEIAGSGKTTRSFLPEVLRKNGYSTAYIQAAPLGFMMKDRFMPVVGFQTVLGDASFDHSYKHNEWGVDDLAFFEKAIDQLKALAVKSDPWFVTLLTVGTHHPFLVPDSYKSHADETERIRSFYYADEALKWFLGECES
ncbi:MAG: LTA synthase family protein [Planctomycetes bacterium]|nr:LTA synthase family protein [Planctomycetota bacterium]